MLFPKTLCALALVSLSLAACGQTTSPVEPAAGSHSLSAARAPGAAAGNYLDQVNARLAAEGAPIRVAYAEYVTGGPDAHTAGQTVFANDRQLRLTAQWVPFLGNPVRDRDDTISYLVFQALAIANGSIDSEPEIDASFDTWEGVNCSKLDIVKAPDTGVFPSAIFAGGNPFVADIIELGFLPGLFFDLVLGPGAADNVLGVTFTFIWVDENGDPTDLDNNNFDDVAIKEIWYNDNFQWTDTGDPAFFDIQTVAFHENGHGLGLGHFGRVSITNRNGKLHVSPRAAMNAFILGTLREPLGTDNAAYCGIYGHWPN